MMKTTEALKELGCLLAFAYDFFYQILSGGTTLQCLLSVSALCVVFALVMLKLIPISGLAWHFDTFIEICFANLFWSLSISCSNEHTKLEYTMLEY